VSDALAAAIRGALDATLGPATRSAVVLDPLDDGAPAP
jgi:hypothetical protein